MGKTLSSEEALIFKSAILHALGVMYHELGWTQQFHLGALRNNNTRALRVLGPDTGWDSIGDFSQASALSKFLNKLDSEDKLAKTIIYNLNPADNELMASMIGNFKQDSFFVWLNRGKESKDISALHAYTFPSIRGCSPSFAQCLPRRLENNERTASRTHSQSPGNCHTG